MTTPFGRDRDALRALRDGDRRLHLVAAGIDHLALGIDLEAAVARIGERAVGLEDLEKAATLDRQIQRVAGVVEAALREAGLGGDHAHAGAQLQSGWIGGRVRGGATHLGDVLVQQVVEYRAAFLEAVGIDVGEVVSRHRHLCLLSVEAGFSRPECRFHGALPMSVELAISSIAAVSPTNWRCLRRRAGP